MFKEFKFSEIFTESFWWAFKIPIAYRFCFTGYFECMKEILNQKVPSSLERSSTPPTPVAASVLDLIMSPVSFATATADKAFRSAAVDNTYIYVWMYNVYFYDKSCVLLPAMLLGKNEWVSPVIMWMLFKSFALNLGLCGVITSGPWAKCS